MARKAPVISIAVAVAVAADDDHDYDDGALTAGA
jgi:hypothetical protein